MVVETLAPLFLAQLLQPRGQRHAEAGETMLAGRLLYLCRHEPQVYRLGRGSATPALAPSLLPGTAV